LKKAERKKYLEAARQQWQTEGEIEIDDNAKVSQAEGKPDGNGAFVQGWVWVYLDEETGSEPNPMNK